MNFPKELRYTADHEWLRVEEDGSVTVGITDFAQRELGDIVYVEIDEDGELEAAAVFGTVEAVKTVSDLFMPVPGEIIETNEKLEDHPDWVNEDCYGKGWMIKIKVADVSAVEALLDAEAYEASVA